MTSWDCDLGWLVKNLDTGEEKHPDVMGGWFWEDDSMIIAIFVGTPGENQIISNMLITVHVLRTSWSTMEYPHDVW